MTTPSFEEHCGVCGYHIGHPDPEYVKERFDEHDCVPAPSPAAPKRWHQSAFSPDLWFVLGAFAVLGLCVYGFVVRGR